MEKWVLHSKPHLVIYHVEVKSNQQHTASDLRATQKRNRLTLQYKQYLMLEIKDAGINQLNTGKTSVLTQDSLPTPTTPREAALKAPSVELR